MWFGCPLPTSAAAYSETNEVELGYVLSRPYRREIPTICAPLGGEVGFALLQEL